MLKNTKTYERSNKIVTIPNLIVTKATKNLYHKLREQGRITQVNLQNIADLICENLGIQPCIISLGGRQPHQHTGQRLKQKTMGNYRASRISIFKFTAVRQKERAPKTAISTLLHEINHHIDFALLRLDNSLHTAGFYKRLTYLKNMIAN